MKKIVPVIIAIALICVVVFLSFGKKVVDKYSYGTERADLNEYFQIHSANEIPIVLQDERIEETAKYINGYVYFDRDTVEKYLTVRFYLDRNENLLLYTNAQTTISSEVGSNTYIENGEVISKDYSLCELEGDTLYIAADYIKKFINFSYEVFEEPRRIQMYTEWGQKEVATIKSDTQVRWRGGVKSEILTDVKASDVVEILEVMDDWTKVKTNDAFIGYVPNSKLTNEEYVEEIPVTDVPKEEYSSLVRDHKINLTWHNIEYPQGSGELYEACAKIKSVNVISPTWYWVTDNDGNINSVANASYVEAAHAMGMEVWPLVSNFHYGTDVDTYELLSYTSKRAVLINNLITETVNYGADGINLDFESVSSKAGDHYVQFVRELALACHKAGLVLSVDNYVPTEYTAHYNRKEQGVFADYIIIMGYDEHYIGSDAGSVASAPWVRDGIENTLKYVPKEKVINAIPFYTRVWMTSGGSVTSEAVDMEVSQNFISRNGITTKWDDETSQEYGEAQIGDTLYQVWLEDAKSLGVKLNVMDTFGIAGVASWKLGQETPDIWDVIETYMSR